MQKIELSWEQRNDIAYNMSNGISASKLARKYHLPTKTIETVSGQYWKRWHELIDIREERKLNEKESEEYKQMNSVVTKLHEEEAKRCRKVLEPWLERHKKSLDSLERLIAAAERMVNERK